ncbi:hypothetical protein [Lysinibacillus fusiformis]|uniref:hypothetical protein n=1 Tax=Lysinibacillus fusiformis TaxID=28031 RepID=UPI00046A7E67|nr:hypothetical protein [Lysinibacillus fusiformis]
MRGSGFREHMKEGHHRGGRHRGMEGTAPRGAKTFRRGRAIAFLETLNVKRATLKQQLEQPEFQSIQQILVGELKAIDMVIQEFSQLFDIHESETVETAVDYSPIEGDTVHEKSE